MAQNKNENNNKSFFLYTALIFIVAIIMVMIAFLGQSNVHKNQQTNITGNSITENAAKVSEDNAHLHEELNKASQKISEYEAELQSEKELKNTYDLVLSAYLYAEAGNIDMANQILTSVNKDLLFGDILIIYEKTLQRTGAIQ